MEPDNSLAWAGAGQVAARRSVRERDEFKKLHVQYAFSKQIDYALYPPKTPSILEFFLHLDAAVDRAVRGYQSPAEALHQAQRDYKRYLEVDRIERQRLAAKSGEAN
jgi:maltose-binding protein MalE